MAPLAPQEVERDLGRELELALGRPVEVRYGRARRTVVHAQERGGVLVVRLNAFFSEAPDDVRRALASWLRSGRRAPGACRVLDDWIDERLARLHRDQPRDVSLRTAGRHHDLAPLVTSLLEGEFRGTFGDGPPGVTWGRQGRSRSRHTLRLGSYDYHARLVRIHTVLDQPAVPDWFVRFVLFHELLHAELDDAPTPGARRRHHGPDFRRRERAHPDYRRASAWEERNVRALIRSARSGRQLAVPRQSARRERERPTVRAAPRAAASRLVQRLLFD